MTAIIGHREECLPRLSESTVKINTFSAHGRAFLKKSESKVFFLVNVTSGLDNGLETARYYFPTLAKPFKNIVGLGILQSLTLPYTIHNIWKSFKDGFNSSLITAKIDAALESMNEMGAMFDAAASTGGALVALKLLKASQMMWTAPFTGIASLLSIAGIFIHVRAIKRFSKSVKEIDGVMQEKVTLSEKVKATWNMILGKSDSKLERSYLVKESDKVRVVAKKIIQSIDEGIEQGIHQGFEGIKNLKSRIQRNITSRKLAIITITIGIIATAIFLFTPLAPLAYALSSISVFIALNIAFEQWKHRNDDLFDAQGALFA